MVRPCLTNNTTTSGDWELDPIPRLQKKNDLHSRSIGMKLNPAFKGLQCQGDHQSEK